MDVSIIDKDLNTNIEYNAFENGTNAKYKSFKNGTCVSDMANITLENIRFENCDFTNVNFIDSKLSHVVFARCKIKLCHFDKATIENCTFLDCEGYNNHFTNSNISLSRFESCTMTRDSWFRHAELTDVSFYMSYLTRSSFYSAILEEVSFRGTDLRHVNFSYTQSNHIAFDETTSGYALVCPEEGSFIAFKKVDLLFSHGCCLNQLIVKLEIPEDALRSSATSRKCRASKAKVLGFYTINHEPYELDINEVAVSHYDGSFKYELGKTYTIENFDTDRWDECSTGIHFFMTFDEAVNY